MSQSCNALMYEPCVRLMLGCMFVWTKESESDMLVSILYRDESQKNVEGNQSEQGRGIYACIQPEHSWSIWLPRLWLSVWLSVCGGGVRHAQLYL